MRDGEEEGGVGWEGGNEVAEGARGLIWPALFMAQVITYLYTPRIAADVCLLGCCSFVRSRGRVKAAARAWQAWQVRRSAT